MLTEQEADERAMRLAKDGKLIEAAWVKLVLRGAPPSIDPSTLSFMEVAFFRGAKHMLTLMVTAQRKGLSNEEMTRMVNDVGRELTGYFDDLMQPPPGAGSKAH